MTDTTMSFFEKYRLSGDRLFALLLLALGLSVLYVPTLYDLAGGVWQTDDQAHGPLILLIILWLFWKVLPDFSEIQHRPAMLPGLLLLVFGLLCYVLGRSQEVLYLEIGSMIFVLTGLVLSLKGFAGVRVAWFPLLYIIFLIPLPGFFVDAITGPLKGYISLIAEHILYALGYPIARSGVVLSIGPYQLLVADACSGLHSMYSLSALGLLYMYITGRKSRLHNAIMLFSILPVAFAANIVRVMVLVLVTYYLGDEAGQGFLHGAAGMVLMAAALLFLFLMDSLLSIVIKDRKASRDQAD